MPVALTADARRVEHSSSKRVSELTNLSDITKKRCISEAASKTWASSDAHLAIYCPVAG